MSMNLPNKLTILRVLMIPFFVVFMVLSLEGNDIVSQWAAMSGTFVLYRRIAGWIFIAASFTDFLDGYIARKYSLITDFGKFMDPLADKLLVCSALILFTGEGSLPAWVVIIIIAREFIISGFRLVASDNGVVIAASKWGKVKTVTQMILCVVLIFPGLPGMLGDIAVNILIVAATLLTVISLIDYIVKNIAVITEK